MHDDPVIETTYLYDGTTEGLLTAVFTAFERKERPTRICRIEDHIPCLCESISIIKTDVPKANRVRDMLMMRCGNEAYRFVLKASLSFDEGAAFAVFEYIAYLVERMRTSPCSQCKDFKHCADKKRSPSSRCFTFKRMASINDISDPAVNSVFAIARSVDNECEKIRQFARFEHLRNGRDDVWFARINPKHAIVPLIMGHFVERFNVQPFIIYDENHGIAGVYEGKGWFLVRAGEEDISENGFIESGEEECMQEAWRMFYRSLSIDSRYNPELRRAFMPKRFWKSLTEMQDGTTMSMKSDGRR